MNSAASATGAGFPRAGSLRPLATLAEDPASAEAARGLAGVVFDLDDTVLDRGELGLDAYRALFELRDAGLALVACTGRPAGWGELVQRQWPLDATVAENGAVRFFGGRGGAPVTRELDATDAGVAAEELAELTRFALGLVREHPEIALADDAGARVTDVTLDVGEHRRAPRELVAALEREAARAGLRTTTSSVHLHLTRAATDKASGAVRALARLGFGASTARHRFAFVGDSGNDAAAFAAFSWSFGVANVREHLRRLTVPPRFVATRARGSGFAEVARAIVVARARGF